MVWQCINTWNKVFSVLCDNFRHYATIFGTVRLFRENIFELISSVRMYGMDLGVRVLNLS